MIAEESIWSPPGDLGHDNFYNLTSVPQVSLSGAGSAAQRWATQNAISEITFGTTAGMGGAHTIGAQVDGVIPPGLDDGGNGAFGPAGPTNQHYQEIGGFESNITALSPGDYIESVGGYASDNYGAISAPTRMTGVIAVINKANPSNTYVDYGFQAISSGAQQIKYAPTAAFRVDGGWVAGLDLAGLGAGAAADILFSNTLSISHDPANVYVNKGGAHMAAISQSQATFSGAVAASFIRTTPTSVSMLQSIDPAPQLGDRAFVTDAKLCVLGAVLSGGGGAMCPAYYDGAWKAG